MLPERLRKQLLRERSESEGRGQEPEAVRRLERNMRLINFLLLLILLIPINSRATETETETRDKSVFEKTGEVISDSAEQVAKKLNETRTRREQNNYFALVNYSPLDMLIPSKIGLTLGSIRTADKTWELEYLRGSVSVPFFVKDLGAMTDQRISLIGRSYFGGNSFNFSYGLSYFDFSIQLGDEILNRVSAGNYPSIGLIEIESVGFNLGIGNRWSFDKNITLGVDWISWEQPLINTRRKSAFVDYASNPNDKDNVDTAIKIISYLPRFTLLKLQFGVLF